MNGQSGMRPFIGRSASRSSPLKADARSSFFDAEQRFRLAEVSGAITHQRLSAATRRALVEIASRVLPRRFAISAGLAPEASRALRFSISSLVHGARLLVILDIEPATLDFGEQRLGICTFAIGACKGGEQIVVAQPRDIGFVHGARLRASGGRRQATSGSATRRRST